MDIVFIRQLQIETVIGIYEWERTIRQRLVLDLEMATDIKRAAASENIADALDYHAIALRLNGFVTTQKFLLIETVAEQCAELLMREFSVTWLRLTVSKPTAIPFAREVGVIIERGIKP